MSDNLFLSVNMSFGFPHCQTAPFICAIHSESNYVLLTGQWLRQVLSLFEILILFADCGCGIAIERSVECLLGIPIYASSHASQQVGNLLDESARTIQITSSRIHEVHAQVKWQLWGEYAEVGSYTASCAQVSAISKGTGRFPCKSASRYSSTRLISDSLFRLPVNSLNPLQDCPASE